MPLEFTTSYLKDCVDLLRYYKRLGERAMAQVSDEALVATPDAESNSIAIMVKHLAGNMRSRFTDFLNTDGEKPDRKRDTEFEAPPKTRAELMAIWETGWQQVFDALAPLKEEQLEQEFSSAPKLIPSCRPSIGNSRTMPITWARLSTRQSTSQAPTGRRLPFLAENPKSL